MLQLNPLVAICVVFACTSNAYNVNQSEQNVTTVCPCQYNYDPVCGSDGVTYMNNCVLNCTSVQNLNTEQISAVYNGECNGSCNCQNVDLPVCTLDGLTYTNECELACKNIERIANKEPIINLAYRTSCRGLPGGCTNVSFPVCGTDNVLYRNRCVLDYANLGSRDNGTYAVEAKNNGACVDGCLCPVTSEPVCGSDGNYYTNICRLECESEKRRRQNMSAITEVDKTVCEACICMATYEPVCANDGMTYFSCCHVECEILRQQKPDLKAVYSGECVKCKCDNSYVPVCGTDRKTYNSVCWLRCQNDSKTNNSIDVFHEGECQKFACDCSYCDEAYQPMCGSDQHTYWNLCWLKCNDRCNHIYDKDAVFLSKRGPC